MKTVFTKEEGVIMNSSQDFGNTKNIIDSNNKLNIIIDNFVDATKENPSIDFVNEKLLHRIIIAESAKAYHTKNIDEENKQGFYKSYKSLIQKKFLRPYCLQT